MFGDIDMYVSKSKATQQMVYRLAHEVNASGVELNYCSYGGFVPGVGSIHKLHVDGHKIDLVESEEPETVCKNFDIGLLNLGVFIDHGELVVFTGEAHDEDLRSNQLTVDVSKLTSMQLRRTMGDRVPKYIKRTGFNVNLLYSHLKEKK